MGGRLAGVSGPALVAQRAFGLGAHAGAGSANDATGMMERTARFGRAKGNAQSERLEQPTGMGHCADPIGNPYAE